MNVSIKNILLGTAILAASVAITLPASAFGRTKLIVQGLPANSAITQAPSQDLLLRADTDGDNYLYVEQQQGALLAVFDVSDPEHMKLVAAVAMQAHSPYDFVAPVGNSELISFRDGSGTALLDLHKPKSPKLSEKTDSSKSIVEPLGLSGSLVSSLPQIQTARQAPPRNVQLIEAGHLPRVLASLTGVTRQVERLETGTIFLLADGKVTIVRSLDVELQYEDDRTFPLAREN
jgi:hypothetical protein